MQPRKEGVPLGERGGEVNGPCAQRLTKKWDQPMRQGTLPARSVMVTGHGIFMRAHLTKFAITATLCAVLAACTNPRGDFPSLALRPFENGAAPEGTAPPPAPIRPATPVARLAELRAAAASADAAFAARADNAGALARAAAGQSAESSARAAALIALADLDNQRGKTASALAALDVLAAEAANALSPDPALTTAQTEVAATLAREDAVIARLWGVLES
jgi:hypothetical protein